MIKNISYIFVLFVFLNANDTLQLGEYTSGECEVIFSINKQNKKITYSLLNYSASQSDEVLTYKDHSIEFKNLYSHFYNTLEDKKFPPGKKAYVVGGEVENNDSFLIQNYGNAMNPYIVFDGCGKYLRYQRIDLLSIETRIKNNDIETFTVNFFKNILPHKTLAHTTLTPYNNIAYYLQKAGANEEAIYLLERIIKKFPNRTVAYYNLGDAYLGLAEKEKAIKAYTTYIEQMYKKDLQKKIPKEVLDKVKK